MNDPPYPTSATELLLLWDRQQEWKRRIGLINEAETFLYLSTYYIEYDRYGIELIDALVDAQRRSVTTILLIDAFGQRLGTAIMSKEDGRRLEDKLTELRDAGGQVDYYRPSKRIDRILGGGQHIKIQASEKGEAIFGSSNITHSSFEAWNELSMSVRGPIVDLLLQDFERLLGRPLPVRPSPKKAESQPEYALEYWTYDPNEAPGRLGVLGRRADNPLTVLLADEIRAAKRSVQLTSFYFKPVPRLFEAVCGAAARGVDIEIYHSGRAALDTDLAWIGASVGYRELLKHGAKVFERAQGEHSKIVLIDGRWAALGSYNFEDAADDRLAEAMIVTSDPRIIEEVSTIVRGLKTDIETTQMTQVGIKQWPISLRAKRRLLGPFKRWI